MFNMKMCCTHKCSGLSPSNIHQNNNDQLVIPFFIIDVFGCPTWQRIIIAPQQGLL